MNAYREYEYKTTWGAPYVAAFILDAMMGRERVRFDFDRHQQTVKIYTRDELTATEMRDVKWFIENLDRRDLRDMARSSSNESLRDLRFLRD